MFKCVFKHHLTVVEDKQVKNFLTLALAKATKHIQTIEQLYHKEGIPVPTAFGDGDIQEKAPKLFSDVFMLFYVTQMTRAAFVTYGDALSTASRQDVVTHFKETLADTVEVYEKGVLLMQRFRMPWALPTMV